LIEKIGGVAWHSVVFGRLGGKGELLAWLGWFISLLLNEGDGDGKGGMTLYGHTALAGRCTTCI
jgi:hypothetical protein